MNYRHGYHAGNFADVHKHVLLLGAIQSLFRKEAPIWILDTHAGRGFYDLNSTEAQKSPEHLTGIAKIRSHKPLPALTQHYLSLVNKLAPSPAHYPGSPALIRQSLRPQDRAAFCELEPSEHRALHQLLRHDQRIGTHHRDGYEALKALLPPKERRGLVLIDPPFEKPNEFSTLTTALMDAYRRFATGVYMVWYPLKSDRAYLGFLNQLKLTGIRRILSTELWVEPKDSPTGLVGSGVTFINPPWELDLTLQEELPILAPLLAKTQPVDFAVKWLVSE
jgi:23S rRNA (adenine2030-N6)-methyltransferase